jgi:integrase
MAAKKITASELERLPAGETLWDSEIRGFGARRQAKGGDITFVWKGRAPRTKRQVFMTIGRWGRGDWTIDKARVKATEHRDAVRLGRDPAAAREEAKLGAMTVAELCDAYLAAVPTLLLGRARRVKKPSTIATDISRINAHIKPLLGKLAVDAVSPADVETFMHRVASGATATARPKKGRTNPAKGGQGTASRSVGLLGALFSFAVKRRLRADNPVRGVIRPADGRRERRLSAEDYKALGKALTAAQAVGSNPYGLACIRFLALTGWRRGEATGLTWDAIDPVRRSVTLGDTKTGRSVRPLARAAWDAIKDLPRRANSPYVFPAASGDGPSLSVEKLFPTIRAKAGLGADVTLHVLRHSLASVAADLGMSELAIAGLLGHKTASVTGRYVHAADAVMIRAADTAADAVAAAMGEARDTAEVITLPAARIVAAG